MKDSPVFYGRADVRCCRTKFAIECDFIGTDTGRGAAIGNCSARTSEPYSDSSIASWQFFAKRSHAIHRTIAPMTDIDVLLRSGCVKVTGTDMALLVSSDSTNEPPSVFEVPAPL